MFHTDAHKTTMEEWGCGNTEQDIYYKKWYEDMGHCGLGGKEAALLTQLQDTIQLLLWFISQLNSDIHSNQKITGAATTSTTGETSKINLEMKPSQGIDTSVPSSNTTTAGEHDEL